VARDHIWPGAIAQKAGKGAQAVCDAHQVAAAGDG
jgi:hypothetical protein